MTDDTAMSRLLEAMREFFAAAASSVGPLAGTSRLALDAVDWAQKPQPVRPVRHPIAERCLGRACARSGPHGSAAHDIATALLAADDRIAWNTYYGERAGEPDMAAFSRNFTATNLIGVGGALPSETISAGFSLQAPDTYYPPHTHDAEESYWIVGGDGDWKVDTAPWFAVRPGDGIHHPPRARHAMQTNTEPLLTVWLWTSDLDSELLIVRG